MYIFLFLLLSLFSSCSLLRYSPSVEDLQSRKLILLKEEADERILARLNNNLPKSAEAYYAELEAYNGLLEEFGKKIWPDAKLLSLEELDALERKENYLVLRISSYQDAFFRPGLYYSSQLDRLDAAQALDEVLQLFQFYRLEAFRYKSSAKGLVFQVGLSQVRPRAIDFYAFAGLYKWKLEQWRAGKRGRALPSKKELEPESITLRNKKLLLDERQLSPLLYEDEKLRQAYPFAIERASESELLQALEQGGSGLAFGLRLGQYKNTRRNSREEDMGILQESQVEYSFFIFDAQSLLPIARSQRAKALIDRRSLENIFR